LRNRTEVGTRREWRRRADEDSRASEEKAAKFKPGEEVDEERDAKWADM
jgi:hypothetical protein